MRKSITDKIDILSLGIFFFIGFIMFALIEEVTPSWSDSNQLTLFLILSFPTVIVCRYMLDKIFSKENHLVDKIMNCSLRKRHGYSYCTRCPHSYTCADK